MLTIASLLALPHIARAQQSRTSKPAPPAKPAAADTSTAQTASSPAAASGRRLLGRATGLTSRAATVAKEKTGLTDATAAEAAAQLAMKANPASFTLAEVMRMQQRDHAEMAAAQASRNAKLAPAGTDAVAALMRMRDSMMKASSMGVMPAMPAMPASAAARTP